MLQLKMGRDTESNVYNSPPRPRMREWACSWGCLKLKQLELHEAHVPRANNTIKCTCSWVRRFIMTQAQVSYTETSWLLSLGPRVPRTGGLESLRLFRWSWSVSIIMNMQQVSYKISGGSESPMFPWDVDWRCSRLPEKVDPGVG